VGDGEAWEESHLHVSLARSLSSGMVLTLDEDSSRRETVFSPGNLDFVLIWGTRNSAEAYFMECPSCHRRSPTQGERDAIENGIYRHGKSWLDRHAREYEFCSCWAFFISNTRGWRSDPAKVMLVVAHKCEDPRTARYYLKQITDWKNKGKLKKVAAREVRRLEMKGDELLYGWRIINQYGDGHLLIEVSEEPKYRNLSNGAHNHRDIEKVLKRLAEDFWLLTRVPAYVEPPVLDENLKARLYRDFPECQAILDGMDGYGYDECVATLRSYGFHKVGEVVKAEQDLVTVRIPVPAFQGGARHIMIEPAIFDSNGDPTDEGLLRGNEVFVTGHTGPVVFHLQPGAIHGSQFHIANSVQHPQLTKLDTGVFLFISRDSYVDVVKKLGGEYGEPLRVAYYTDPSVVEHFRNLPPYPVLAAHEPEVRRDDRSPEPTKVEYNWQTLERMLDRMSRQTVRVSIGQVRLAINLDTFLSDNKEAIIAYLRSLPPDSDDRVARASKWMSEYEGYVLRSVASNWRSLTKSIEEGAEDANFSGEAALVHEFLTTVPIVPDFMLRKGWNSADVVVLPSRLGSALLKLKKSHSRI